MAAEPGNVVVDSAPRGRPRRTPAEIGKANSAKGKKGERDVAKFLQVNGFIDAKRLVRTGYRNGGNVSQDEGDICGTPGLTWQVKNTAEREWYKVPRWLIDVEAQRIASKSDYGFVVLKRYGHAQAGTWWVHLRLCDVADLLGASRSVRPDAPVRMELADLMPLLHEAGYGDPSVTPLRVQPLVDA